MLRPAPPPWMLKAREFAARISSPVGKPFAAAKKEKVCELYLYDAIGVDGWTGQGVDPKDVVAAVAEAKGADELAIHINSPGGYISDGIAIFNAIRSFNGKRTVYVDGIAASIASVIALAGDRVVTNEGAMWMIHEPAGGVMSFGTADQIEEDARKTATALRKMREMILDVYTRNTGQAVSQISAWMAAETWMTADEAKERGFTDEVVKQTPMDDPDEEQQMRAPPPIASVSNATARDLAVARVRALSDKFSPVPAAGSAAPCQPGKTSTAAPRR